MKPLLWSLWFLLIAVGVALVLVPCWFIVNWPVRDLFLVLIVGGFGWLAYDWWLIVVSLPPWKAKEEGAP